MGNMGTKPKKLLLKKLLHLQEKALRIIDFKPQTLPSHCIFKENKILRISDFVSYKYALFVRKSLRRENVVIFNNMFTPLNLNQNHNTCAAINHLLDIPQKQTCHYGTYSIIFTASKVSNDILRKSNKDLLYCEFPAFKKTIFQSFFSKYENNNWNYEALFCKTAIHGGLFILYSFNIFNTSSLFFMLYLFIRFSVSLSLSLSFMYISFHFFYYYYYFYYHYYYYYFFFASL